MGNVHITDVLGCLVAATIVIVGVIVLYIFLDTVGLDQPVSHPYPCCYRY